MVDFGLSIDYSQERPVSAVGTLQYMAPEVVVCPTKSRPEENKVRHSFAWIHEIMKLWIVCKSDQQLSLHLSPSLPNLAVCYLLMRCLQDNPMLQYGTGADIWAVGVLTYELLTGRAPFDTVSFTRPGEGHVLVKKLCGFLVV